jgi:transposase
MANELQPQVEVPAGMRIETAPKAPEVCERPLVTPSLLAPIAVDNFAEGLSIFRQEERFSRLGLSLDRSRMSRCLQEIA